MRSRAVGAIAPGGSSEVLAVSREELPSARSPAATARKATKSVEWREVRLMSFTFTVDSGLPD
jgi:hypothetical protein